MAEDNCNSAEKRILKEFHEIESNPSDDFKFALLDWNKYEWQFALRGPSGTEFEGGIYHGRITFPEEYPSKPPSVMFLTENGRFKTQRDICLSRFLNWGSSSTVRYALLKLIELMPSYPDEELCSLECIKEGRRVLALNSRAAVTTYGSSECQKVIDQIHQYMLSNAPNGTGGDSKPSQASNGTCSVSVVYNISGNTVHSTGGDRVGIFGFMNEASATLGPVLARTPILEESREIESNPSDNFKCGMLERNLYEWQEWNMTIRRLNDRQTSWRVRDALFWYKDTGSDAAGRQDGLLWYKDTGQHLNGEFSMAVVQANSLLEDQSQVESGPYGTFVGIYDGHGGPETSRYINDHLLQNLKRFISEQQSMSVDVIRKAYQATEEGFLSVVTEQWPMKPQIAAVGSCCLVGVICGGTLYIANVGDSRAVLGRVMKATGELLAIQLSSEHNVAIESVRQEMHSLHPDDPHIVVLKRNVWRVKGIIQLSRSIGDIYLKKAEFNSEPLYARFRLREPFKRPILSSEPSISVRELQPHDQFVIFASDGLWEYLSNQEAVDIVQNHPRSGSARRLVKTAVQEAAKKREMKYSDLKKIGRGVRRHFHDDITVIVVFLDSNLVSRASSARSPVCL
ncbi:hypothetical protein ACE6H2_024832 [Prunus campanulata]